MTGNSSIDITRQNLVADIAKNRVRVILVRHGATDNFDADGKPVDPCTVRLNDIGIRQILAIRDALSDESIDRIICSGDARTVQTAEIIRGARSLQVDSIESLREIEAGRSCEIGDDSLRTEMAYGFDHANDAKARFCRGDTFIAFEARVISSFYEELERAPKQGCMVFALHNGVNRLIISSLVSGDRSAMPAIEQQSGCINIIDIDIVDKVVLRAIVQALNFRLGENPLKAARLTSMERVYLDYSSERLVRSSSTSVTAVGSGDNEGTLDDNDLGPFHPGCTGLEESD